MEKFVAELVGTFFLAFTIGMAASAGLAGDMAPVAIGAVLLAMIFACGHISDAHFNPAVTLALWLRGRCATAEIPVYVGAQLLAAGAAALVVRLLTTDGLAVGPALPLLPLFVAELLFTFALAWVILNVATTEGTDGNSFYGLAIASVVTAAAYAIGPVSGAALNPAIVVGLCLAGVLGWGTLWIYFSAQFLGATAAAWAFRAWVRR